MLTATIKGSVADGLSARVGAKVDNLDGKVIWTPLGARGVGIEKIEKTATNGLVDTYTITYTDGRTMEYTVTNGEKGAPGDSFTYKDFTPEQLDALKGEPGVGIWSINRTSGNGDPGTIDTYTIVLTNGGTSQFQVYNGKDGKTPVKGQDYTDGYTPQKNVDYFDGKNGVSPTVSITPITGGTRVSITDASGTKVFDVMDGKDGAAGSGSGDMLASMYDPQGKRMDIFGYADDLLKSVNAGNVQFADGQTWQQKYDAGEFKGDPGKDGAAGQAGKDGTSVTVSNVSESSADGGTNVVTFSDGKKLNIKNGSKGSDGYTPQKNVDYFDGAPGEPGYTPVKGKDYFDGAPGAPGDPGYTPQKGTDYWTAADKAEMVADVLAALPSAEGVKF